MKLVLDGDRLRIVFGKLERVLGFKKAIEVLLEDIEGVSTEKPSRSWRDIRAPGTYFPKIIRAGTYHTPRGKEFWYMVRGRKPLVIELRSGDLKRIVLGLREGENELWKKRLEERSKLCSS